MSGKKRRASAPQPPPAKRIKLNNGPEVAAEEDGFRLIRSLDLSLLRPETIACLRKHNYDPLKKDPHAKVVVRSGSISHKCELVRSTHPIRPFKIVAKTAIDEGECVAVYMGSLIELARCTEHNIWQYEIPARLFPPKKGIPTLVLDASRSANECRFLHAEEWYTGKTANVEHKIIWDAHEHVPQIIYRATRNIAPGEDLLMKWGETGVQYKLDYESRNKDNDKITAEKEQVADAAKLKNNRATQLQKNKLHDEQNAPADTDKAKKAKVGQIRKSVVAETTAKTNAPQNEASRKAREEEIIRTKKILVKAKKIEENHERIQKILEEKKLRDLNNKAPQRKVNYGTTKVTKKVELQKNNDKSIESDHIENGEDQPLEVEELRNAKRTAHPKPVVEIDFFSQKETVQTVTNSSISTNNMNDVMFDLNDSLALSDDEEEVELETLVLL